MKPTTELPVDPELPGMEALRTSGLSRAVPVLHVGEPLELRLLAHKPGKHATLDARTESRHFAIRVYSRDPAPEAHLHVALADAGLAGDVGARVPRLITWQVELRILVVGWLEGKTIHDLLRDGQGARAGAIAADWLRRVASVSVKLGKSVGADKMVRRSQKWVAAFHAADPRLGAEAATLAVTLGRTRPHQQETRLIHGSFHHRNLLDLGDGPGVIDWQRFGQGPAEIDAGTFLASLVRLGLEPQFAAEAARAREVFLSQTTDLLDQHTLSWYRAAGLLCNADRLLSNKRPNWEAKAHTMFQEGEQLAASG